MSSSSSDIRRPDGARRHAPTPDEVNRLAAVSVKRHAADAAEACEFLHMLGIKEVGGRKVLNAPASTALPRRGDGSGRIAPHAHQAAKDAQ